MPNVNEEVIKLAQKIWDYHHLNHKIEKADLIFVLGSHDTRVVDRAIELYKNKFAPKILFSGGLGRLTKEIWIQTEAEKFAQIAIDQGIPEEAILTETKSTNTGHNISFSFKLLKSKGLIPSKVILIQKPYMERRSYAAFKKFWLDHTTEVMVTSPQFDFLDYPTEETPLEAVISLMVGDLQRIKIYPKKGFQIPQEIPNDVWNAFEKLVEMGFDKDLI